ncbi:hypothetical protein BH09VER1_BH09VER1_39700 [soil metagenome]
MTIRWKVAIAAGVFSLVVIAIFAGLSAWWFSYEQFDILSVDSTQKLSPKQVVEARVEIARLVMAYLVALPFVAVFTALGAWFISVKLTAPLVSLAHAAEQMDAHTLHERVAVPKGRDEISKLARVLNSLFERLEVRFVQASRFSADASHELRTPLAIMRGSLEEEIRADPQGPKTLRFVELLEQNQRLASIADKLLLLARADAGKLLSQAETFNFSELLQEIVEDISILADHRHLRLETVVLPDILVSGDRSLLRQLLLNLFDNAVNYNVSSGWIRAELAGPPGHPIFTISNSGEIIPDPQQRRLFERFFRANSSRDRQSGGAGLGLSLCREIALAHGGELTLLSSNSNGTVFCLAL